jgi:CubicO group peptidase (beta-lactamase class C family)
LAFDDQRTLTEPGRARIYSNRGYEMLGAAVGDRTGMEFDRYLTEAVLEPLALAQTRLEGTAAAGLVGPLDDLVRLARELMAPTLVSTQTLSSAVTVAFPGLAGVLPGFGRQAPMDWGLGFDLKDDKSRHWTGARNSPGTFGHFGGSGSFVWVDPAAGLACVALSGRDFGEWAATRWPVLSDAVVDQFGPRSGPGLTDAAR